VIIDKKELKSQRLGDGLGDHLGLSWTCSYCGLVGQQSLKIEKNDRKILRELARQVAEIASRPGELHKKNLWKKHNSLKETAPLVFCDPELAWYELIPVTDISCRGSLARIWEFRLKKEIYWKDIIKDDRVILPEFTVHRIFTETSRGIERKLKGGGNGGSYTWDPAIEDHEDIERLRPGKIIADEAGTSRLIELARGVFEGILDVRLESSYWWSFGMTHDLIMLRGFENILMDMYDNPGLVHRLMAFLRDENIKKLDFLEDNNFLSLNNTGDFVGTGGYGWTDELPSPGFDGEHVRTMDMWGYSESQETTNVSPDFFKEFVFPYQNSILERFGLNIYGCCEPLDKRLDIVKLIPRLRRVTVSPWSDPVFMAEALGKDYVYCRKINPAYMSTPAMDEESARRELRETYIAAQKYGCPAEVMLRDVLTLSFNPGNAAGWVRIAREEASRIYG
jgi:hypothetical protein